MDITQSLFIHSLQQGVKLNQQPTARTVHMCLRIMHNCRTQNTAQNSSEFWWFSLWSFRQSSMLRLMLSISLNTTAGPPVLQIYRMTFCTSLVNGQRFQTLHNQWVYLWTALRWIHRDVVRVCRCEHSEIDIWFSNRIKISSGHRYPCTAAEITQTCVTHRLNSSIVLSRGSTLK